MPRVVNTAIRAILDADYAETHDVVEIILPLKIGETEDDRIRYFVAATSGLEVDDQLYEPLLRSIGAIKFSLGKAPDNSEIRLDNVSRTFGSTLTDTTRALDGAKVVIRRAFKTTSGAYESVELFHGYVRDVKVDQDAVNLNIVSDMSRRSNQVASRAVTQRCIWTFRGVECGWTPDQPGDPTACNKVFDDAGGCLGHGNQPRFGGVPTLTPKAQEILGIGTRGRIPNGYPEDPNDWIDRGWRFQPYRPFIP